jgi:hypothetical protein
MTAIRRGFGIKNYHHALLAFRAVKSQHQRVAVRIDDQDGQDEHSVLDNGYVGK